MAITTLSMVLTVFILNLHHITDRPVPRWVRKLVLVYLGRILGFCRDDVLHFLNSHPTSYQPATPKSNHRNKGDSLNNIHSNGVRKESDINAQPLLDSNEKQIQLEDAKNDHIKEWKLVAEVLDRLFFWLFLLAILVTTLILFHPLTDGCLPDESNG